MHLHETDVFMLNGRPTCGCGQYRIETSIHTKHQQPTALSHHHPKASKIGRKMLFCINTTIFEFAHFNRLMPLKSSIFFQ